MKMIEAKVPFDDIGEMLRKKKSKAEIFLAIIRTSLNNDTRLCALIALSVGTLAAGINIDGQAFIDAMRPQVWKMYVGLALVCLSPTPFLFGLWRYHDLWKKLNGLLEAAKENPEEPEACKELRQAPASAGN